MRDTDSYSQTSYFRFQFLGKGVPKMYSKFTGEYPCLSVILIKFQSNFFEITLRHGCSPANLLYIFRTPSPKNTSGRLLKIFRQRFGKTS